MTKAYLNRAALLSICLFSSACSMAHQEKVIATISLEAQKGEKAILFCRGEIDAVATAFEAAQDLTDRNNAWKDDRRTAANDIPLEDTKVVQAVLNMIVRKRGQTARSLVNLLSDDLVGQSTMPKEVGDVTSDSPSTKKTKLLAALDALIETHRPERLTHDDYHEFFHALLVTKSRNTVRRIYEYESAYLNGAFTDRFGTTWDAPKASWKVSDDQIGDSLTVVLEALADEVFIHTPVWYAPPQKADPKDPEAGRTYYPRAQPKKPTVLAVNKKYNWPENVVQIADPKSKTDPQGCGMTPVKMDAVLYLSNKAGTWAAGEAGLLLGANGGVNVGLPIILGKLSIGDNQTLQAIVKAVLAYVAKRTAYEASWHVLKHVDETNMHGVGDLLEKVVFKKGDDDTKSTDKPKS